jgi:integrase
MPYKKAGRPTWRTDLQVETGWWKGVALPCPLTVDGRKLAVKIEAAWNALASEHRAWDILEAVVSGRWSIGKLYDEWARARGDVHVIRRRLNDIYLVTIRAGFEGMYPGQAKPEQVKRMARHLDALFARPLLASEATADELTTRLHAVKAKRNTLRIVHSSWSVFFDYARTIKHVVPTNPMEDVARPARETPPIRFYELDTIERIVDWQGSARRRALFAFLYGTGVEISVALGLTRADVNAATKEVRAPGTKAHTRDRVVRVDDWAWDRFWPFVKDSLPAVELFAGIDRHKASKWHRQTIGAGEHPCHNQYRSTTRDGLQLREGLKMYAARHAWAIRHLRAGVPVAVVQRQLGHSTAKETLDTYGAFVPSGVDRDHWAKEVGKAEARRRNAK